jgi:hypothetical protein
LLCAITTKKHGGGIFDEDSLQSPVVVSSGCIPTVELVVVVSVGGSRVVLFSLAVVETAREPWTLIVGSTPGVALNWSSL